MVDNANMKNNDLSKRCCRYRIVLEVQTEEQMDKMKKLRAVTQESSVGVQTQLTEKKISDNLDFKVFYSLKWGSNGLFSGKLLFSNVSEGFHRFPRSVELFSCVCVWGGGGVKMLISIELMIFRVRCLFL